MATQADMNQPTEKTTHEREIIVTNNGGGDGGSNNVASTILAIVGILVVLLVGWFAIQAIGSDGGPAIPDSIDINLKDGDAPAPASLQSF